MALLSGGVSHSPSFLLSVVRKPPMAGPKPTHAMSTSRLWRSISGSFGSRCIVLSLLRVIQCFRNHDLRQGFCRAVFRQHRSGQAAVQFGPESLEGVQSVTCGTWTGLQGMLPLRVDDVGCDCGDTGDQRLERFQFVTGIAALVAFLVPSRVTVVSVHK